MLQKKVLRMSSRWGGEERGLRKGLALVWEKARKRARARRRCGVGLAVSGWRC